MDSAVGIDGRVLIPTGARAVGADGARQGGRRPRRCEVALTALIGPLRLFKCNKDAELPAGMPITAWMTVFTLF